MDKPTVMDANVILEACPPPLADREKAYAVLRQSFAAYNSFHAVSIPDLQDEGEFQRQRERVPNEEFANFLYELTNKPMSLYKVSVTTTSAEYERWLDHASKVGCHDIFLVGADATDKAHREGAIGLGNASDVAREKGFNCGGIINSCHE